MCINGLLCGGWVRIQPLLTEVQVSPTNAIKNWLKMVQKLGCEGTARAFPALLHAPAGMEGWRSMSLAHPLADTPDQPFEL